jgi:hypothetical protein
VTQAEATNIAKRYAHALPGTPLPPLPSTGPGTNWVDKAGGLPDHLEDVARHVFWIANRGNLAKVSDSIADAVNWCKHVCATGETITGQKVHPQVRAKNCAAVASWEAKRLKADVT